MVDTTSLNSLIKALRAETTKGSINPERLGSLLQKIADVLATSASMSDIEEAAKVATRIKSIGNVLTVISKGSADSEKIRLSYNLVNVLTGKAASFPDAIVFQSASDTKAGVMTAEQVRSLNDNEKSITSITTSLQGEITTRQSEDKAIRQAIAALSGEIEKLSQSAKDSISRIASESATRSNGDSGLSNRIDMLGKSIESVKEKPDFTHIETEISDLVLKCPLAGKLIGKGLTPLIFRCVIWQNRERQRNENGHREYKDKRHGWHVHYGKDKIKFTDDNIMLIRDDRRDSQTIGQYFSDAKTLFHYPKEHKVGYGKRTYDLHGGHRLKFAIAFAKDPKMGVPFDFSCLRTNLARFNVYACKEADGDRDEFSFSI